MKFSRVSLVRRLVRIFAKTISAREKFKIPLKLQLQPRTFSLTQSWSETKFMCLTLVAEKKKERGKSVCQFETFSLLLFLLAWQLGWVSALNSFSLGSRYRAEKCSSGRDFSRGVKSKTIGDILICRFKVFSADTIDCLNMWVSNRTRPLMHLTCNVSKF